MLSFCPFCSNILFLEKKEHSNLHLTCDTCPVFFPVAKTTVTRNYYHLKEVGDVRDTETWENADSTKVSCPKCGYHQAYFTQLQTRSADEPMTIFYRCSSQGCGFNWLPIVAPMAKLVPITSSFAEIKAIEYLKSGCVIAVPTDTVYGLACDATNSSTIDKLYSIKGRHREKPLAVCLSDVTDVEKIACVEHLPCGLLSALLPGPVTLILRCLNSSLDKSLTLSGKIGVRIPNYSYIRTLARGLEKPLALT